MNGEEANLPKEVTDEERNLRLKVNIMFDSLERLMALAKENAPEKHGISLELHVGEVEAGCKVEYSPPVIRYSRGRGQRETKQATRDDLEAILHEYPDSLELVELDTEFRIKTKKFLDDLWRPIMDKLKPYGAEWMRPEGEPRKCWVIPKKPA